MRYSLLAPAKRVRPLIALLAAEQVGAPPLVALDAGVAVECIHAASLVLDDLPCMDDATERRGRPANHRTYGEDTAVLAAVGLLNQAFAVLAGAEWPAATRTRAVAILAEAVGPDGLTGGQERDLRPSPTACADDIERTYRLKTAVLFGAAAELGGLAAGATDETAARLRRFGLSLGLAFQAFDDLLDTHATAADLGKDVGQDAGKPTLVSTLGSAATEARAQQHVAAAISELDAIGGAGTRLGRFAGLLVTQMSRPAAHVSANPVASAS
jgi:geranylgeranyl diphosphate synthase type II